MIHIDLFDNPPPQELIDEGNALTEELKSLPSDERNDFIDKHDKYWSKLKDHYMRLSHGKCWYTEAKEIASSYHMDHFRPKRKTTELKNFSIKTSHKSGAYWWLAFNWENYRLSASTPNTSKGTYFPLLKGTKAINEFDDVDKEEIGLLDPTNEYDVTLIAFGLDGKVYPACPDVNSWDAQRVEISTRVYNLDYVQLVEARIEIQHTCKTRIDRIIRAQRIYNKNKSKDSREDLMDRIKELKAMTKPEAELSAVARNYIRNSDEEFIRNIVG